MKFKLMGLTVLAAILAVVGLQCAQRIKQTDLLGAQLSAAIMRARASLPRFRDRIVHPRAHDRAYFIRAQFPDREGRTEYLWVRRVALTATGFSGEIAEQPYFGGLKLGDRIEIPNKRVVDWTIKHDDGSTEGDFTQGLEPGTH